MTELMFYFKDHIDMDGSTLDGIRVSVVNRWGRMIKDMSYNEFKQMKGHHQVRLHNMDPIAVMGRDIE